MKIAIISHPDCTLHFAGENHPESAARIISIQHALEQYSFPVPLAFLEAPLATKDQLSAVHEPDYVNEIFAIAPDDGMVSIDEDTWMSPGTLTAALRAAGAVILAVDVVMQGETKIAFCNIRPPGHHAERDRAMGFCFFNNVAVGVAHAIKQYGLERIAIIDFDVHHGNGTQNIFQDDPRVLYCSSFEHPFYPGYDPANDNEHILNVPIVPGTTGEAFCERVAGEWFDKLNAFKPQLIFFSAGFDAHIDDPLADLNLTESDYVWLTKQIAKIAKAHCDGKMISVLEGGYQIDALEECVPAHVKAMLT